MSEPDRADIPEELEDEGDEDCKRIEYNEGEDDKEEHLIEPYRTQLFVYRLIERVRACVTNIHNTRAIY
ncbi:unnamed protein product, partial [Rotaria sp. Silwood2]